eukprot:PhM_4_TR15920/c0_g1_i3/m.11284
MVMFITAHMADHPKKAFAFATVTFGLTLFELFKVLRRRRPGPRRLPIIGTLHLLFRNIPRQHKWFDELREQYGNYVTLENVWLTDHLVSDPALVEEVLSDINTFAERDRCSGFRAFSPNGLLALETNTKWKQHRAVLSQLFRDEYLAHYCDAMCKSAQELVHRWVVTNKGRCDDVAADLNRVTMDILCKTVMGLDLNALHSSLPLMDKGRMITYALYIVAISAFPTFMWPFVYIPYVTSTARTFDAELTTLSDSLIEKARTGTLDPKCMLSVASRATYPDGTPWSNADISHEVQHFLLAGHETTANTLTFALFLLSINPHVQDRARREILTVCGGKDGIGSSGHFPYEALSRMPYVWAIFRETLRMYPTVPHLLRVASKDTFVGGRPVRKSENVFLNFYACGYDEASFPNSTCFMPERWLDEDGSGRAVGTDPYLNARNFGGGMRRCIGQRFAEEEAMVVLSVLLSKHRVEAVNERGPVLDTSYNITLTAKSELQLRFVDA